MVDLCCATSFSHSHRRSLLHSPKSHAIISSCVDPITGGRVSEIVKQQNKFGCSWCLPLSQEEDKFVDFCDTYKGFIKVPSAYETFFEKWESAKSKNPPSSADGKKKSNILLRALYSSFKGDLLKAFLGKITWSILLFFSIWYFIFNILDFIKGKGQGEDISPVPHCELILCGTFFCGYGFTLHWYPTDGYLFQCLGVQGQGCPHNRHLQEDDYSRLV
jgi:hypothetical protein